MHKCPLTVLMKKHSPQASQSWPQGFVVPCAAFLKRRLNVIAPDAAFQGNPRVSWAARRTDFARARTATTTIQPAIGTPSQTVGEVVVVVGRHLEPIQHDVGRTVRECRRAPSGMNSS